MHIPDWIVIVALNGALIAGAGFSLWFANALIDAVDKNGRRKRFEEDLTDALKHNQPTWAQVLDFADLRDITQSQLNRVLRLLIRDVLTGKNSELKPHLNLLQEFLRAQRASEPFDGMPNAIRIHLERLKEKGAEVEGLLEPLTAQIRELLAMKSKEYSRQKRYTVGGFVIGVVALIFAGFAYFYPQFANVTLNALPSVASAPQEGNLNSLFKRTRSGKSNSAFISFVALPT